MTETTRSAPYERAAQDYRRAGWAPLPIGYDNKTRSWVPGKKSAPPAGFTGHGRPYPDGGDIGTWLSGPAALCNIGLRLPPDIIGLDVDDYAKAGETKTGGATLAALVERFGPLPPTWITSARTDGVSGIRFYRVPIGLNWPGEAGPNIEIIQAGHRYALVMPSVNPEAGGAMYLWHYRATDLGQYATKIPTTDEIPYLPQAWIDGLSLSYERAEKADLGGASAQAWWDSLPPGPMCKVVHTLCTKAVDELKRSAGSRHETARDAVRAALAFGAEGHRGAREGVEWLAAVFADAVGPERSRSGEWQRLVAGAVQLAAKKHPSPRPFDPCATPPVKPFEGVIENPTVPEVVTPAPGALTLPAEFWEARESHRLIRQAAHSRARAADVVFYGVLVRLAALAPHEVYGALDTGVGKGSLNLFTAVVGASGAGKSSGLSVAADILPAVDLESVPLGSGEGLAEAYMGMVSVDDPGGAMTKDGSPKKVRQKAMVRHNVLAAADEGASLNKMLERTGATVGEALRSAWSGESIGQKNGREETTRIVHKGTYSLGLMIGYQLRTIMPLLADVDAGTPQRFLYAWATDPTIPPRSERVEWPGAVLSPFPAEVATDLPPNHAAPALFTQPAGRNVTPITYAQEIRDELYDEMWEKASNEASPLLADVYRSQHSMLKVKVATALAALDHARRHVTAEDWRLAQIVLDTSDAVSQYARAVADAGAREEARRADAAHVSRAVMAHAAVGEHELAAASVAVQRLASSIAHKVHAAGEDGMARAAARRTVASSSRPIFGDALALAVEAGWLADDGRRLTPGHSLPAL